MSKGPHPLKFKSCFKTRIVLSEKHLLEGFRFQQADWHDPKDAKHVTINHANLMEGPGQIHPPCFAHAAHSVPNHQRHNGETNCRPTMFPNILQERTMNLQKAQANFQAKPISGLICGFVVQTAYNIANMHRSDRGKLIPKKGRLVYGRGPKSTPRRLLALRPNLSARSRTAPLWFLKKAPPAPSPRHSLGGPFTCNPTRLHGFLWFLILPSYLPPTQPTIRFQPSFLTKSCKGSSETSKGCPSPSSTSCACASLAVTPQASPSDASLGGASGSAAAKGSNGPAEERRSSAGRCSAGRVRFKVSSWWCN